MRCLNFKTSLSSVCHRPQIVSIRIVQSVCAVTVILWIGKLFEDKTSFQKMQSLHKLLHFNEILKGQTFLRSHFILRGTCYSVIINVCTE